MKKYLIAGIIVWVPVAVIVFIGRFAVDLLNKLMQIVPSQYQPEVLFGFDIPGFSLIVILLALILTGMLASNWLGKIVIKFSERLLARIPLVRSVYKGVKQSLTVIFSNNSGSFREVVMLEYPKAGVWSIGFKTSKFSLDKNKIMVFIPTTPNPTSGFLVMVPPESVQPLDMKVDDALKMIISLGTAQVNNDDIEGEIDGDK